jgi:hypothetical protein
MENFKVWVLNNLVWVLGAFAIAVGFTAYKVFGKKR